jgi:thiol-disulfide isomerase/thioredoxin
VIVIKIVAVTSAVAVVIATGCQRSESQGATANGRSLPAHSGTSHGTGQNTGHDTDGLGGAPPGRSSGGGRLRSLPPQLEFEGTTLDGKPFVGSDLAERPVVFWFWAPWCTQCAFEGPHVADVARRYGDRVSFVGIAGLDRSREQMRRFVSRTGTAAITQLDDRTGRLYAHFEVTSHSSFLFMTRDGRTTRNAGPLGEAGLERHVRALAGG